MLTYTALFVILSGLLAVSLIDIFGSITSRRWKYTYSYLSILSFTVYFLIGYFASRSGNLALSIFATSLVGIYDATVGWKLSLVFNANFGRFKEDHLKMTKSSRIIGMIGVGIVFGSLGYFVYSL